MASNVGLVDLKDKLTDRVMLCDICSLEFNTTTRQPKLLPCVHSVCLQCLQMLLKQYQKKKKFPCPQCRQSVNFPAKDATSFQNNTTVMAILDLMEQESMQKIIFCGGHAEKAAVYICIECEKGLCATCLITVKDDHPDHDVQELEDAFFAAKRKITKSIEDSQMVKHFTSAREKGLDDQINANKVKFRRMVKQAISFIYASRERFDRDVEVWRRVKHDQFREKHKAIDSEAFDGLVSTASEQARVMDMKVFHTIKQLQDQTSGLTELEEDQEIPELPFYGQKMVLDFSIFGFIRLMPFHSESELLSNILNVTQSVYYNSSAETKLKFGEEGGIEMLMAVVTSRIGVGRDDICMRLTWKALLYLMQGVPENKDKFMGNDGMSMWVHCVKGFPHDTLLQRLMCRVLDTLAAEGKHSKALWMIAVQDALMQSMDDPRQDISFMATSVATHLIFECVEGSEKRMFKKAYLREFVKLSVDKWKVTFDMKTTTEDFKLPIKLLIMSQNPELQKFAVWFIAHYFEKDEKKYCPMFIEESGEDHLRTYIKDEHSEPQSKEQAQEIVITCEQHRLQCMKNEDKKEEESKEEEKSDSSEEEEEPQVEETETLEQSAEQSAEEPNEA